ncbi:MAG TPA: sulfatase-like hydrolase/transferase, partial [Candidatus Sulfotelmatobacter sp.]|nr:sulfatase-like hydrolase/transferase [Candidatus Sulfotelmatobacter sp.]
RWGQWRDAPMRDWRLIFPYRHVGLSCSLPATMIPKRAFLLAGLFFGLALSDALAAAPNILFILTDDLGYGDVGVFFQNARKARNLHSEPWHLTPQIDTLAGQGMQLPQYYCPAPVCAPSRASLLLGVHQGHANVRDNQFDKTLENNHTLASVLKRSGYATVAVGKWGLQGTGGNPAAWPAYPTKRGFDHYFGYVRHVDGHEHYPKEGLYRKPKEVWENDREISSDLDKCYTADLFTARAKKWISDHRAAHPDQPFFMYLAYDTPHAVIELPTQAYPAGGGTNGGLQWLGQPGHMINTASGTIDSYYHPDYAKATWDEDKNPATPEVAWPDVYKRYGTAVRRIDECVGDLMVLLKQLQLETNTLVVFTSDNGPSRESYLRQDYEPDFFGGFGPFDGIKRDTWEGGIRVGAMVRWPERIRPGQISALPCSAADWMATFADAAGMPAPARTDGVSLVPTLTGQGKQRTPTVYVEYFEGGKTPDYAAFAPAHRGRKRKQMQVLRQGNYQAVRYNVTSATDDFEIYDVVADPQQTNNLASQPAFAALQQQVKARVLQVRRPDAGAPRPYDQAAVPAATNSAVKSGRLAFAVFQGNWPWVPEFAALSPLRGGQVAGLDLSVRPCEENFGIAFSGFLTVLAEGDYTFYLKSDSGALFRVHEATVIDDDFRHTGAEVSGTIRLQAGRHPFRLYYRHGGGPRLLSLEYSGPAIERQAIPNSACAF